ncbi:hypothetical protein ACFOG5_14940 [Pedobacter fastidiosus]|nr:hypothetical protein [Pedobacter fastidiosus]
MKKLEFQTLEQILGGRMDACLWAPALFPPLVIGCIMRDIDRLLS